MQCNGALLATAGPCGRGRSSEGIEESEDSASSKVVEAITAFVRAVRAAQGRRELRCKNEVVKPMALNPFHPPCLCSSFLLRC
jgi:hypothetical protein